MIMEKYSTHPKATEVQFPIDTVLRHTQNMLNIKYIQKFSGWL